MRRKTLLLVAAVLAVSGLQLAHAGDSLPKLLDLGADKMKLTPAQISKACKVGECAPK